jgi:hypothetical protein
MPDLANQPIEEAWLYRPDLLGRYAMTTERYQVALQRTAYYLLQLPKCTLAEILNGSDPKEDIIIVKTSVMRLICDVLPTLWARSPPTTDLFFLTALIYPVVIRVVNNPHQHGILQARMSAFLQQVSILLATLALYECLDLTLTGIPFHVGISTGSRCIFFPQRLDVSRLHPGY